MARISITAAASHACRLAFLGAVANLGFVLTAHADLLDDIKRKGEITIATEARFPPFEFIEDGKIVGYSKDLLTLIMQDLPNVRLKQLDLPWQGILPGLSAKRLDYVVTSVTATKERSMAYHLSVPIADATLAIMKRKGDASVKGPDSLGGKRVGSQIGSAQLQGAERLNEQLTAAGTPMGGIQTYVDFSEAYADLGTGRIDAVINSLPNLLEAARQRPDAFEVVMPPFGPKKYFTWVGRKDEDSASLDAFFDEHLRKLNESGKLSELQLKWFNTKMDVPTVLPTPEQ